MPLENLVIITSRPYKNFIFNCVFDQLHHEFIYLTLSMGKIMMIISHNVFFFKVNLLLIIFFFINLLIIILLYPFSAIFMFPMAVVTKENYYNDLKTI